jgi:hypothetical protein
MFLMLIFNLTLFFQNAENATLRQKLNESYKEAENSQISRADTINRLTRSLEDSQKQCRMLLESGNLHISQRFPESMSHVIEIRYSTVNQLLFATTLFCDSSVVN